MNLQFFNLSGENGKSYHSDSLILWIFIALLFHLVLLLGVSFTSPEPKKVSKAIEITLVNSAVRKEPKNANYLAQENQIGAGLKKQKPKPNQQKIPQIATKKPTKVKAKAKAIVKEPKKKPKKSKAKVKQPKKKQKKTKVKQPKNKKIAAHRVITQKNKIKKVKKVTVKPQKKRSKKTTKNTKPAELSMEALERQIAQLGERVKYLKQSAKKTNIKFVNSISAHKYVAAQYVRDWERKVERIGNLNYPKIAREKGFSGTLSMDVGIKANGRIYRIRIVKSSGNKALDDAAKRIVRMSEPFSPLPKQILNQLDVLVIRRVWRFTDESGLAL
ncbi:MAG: energy transducer TonB [Methylococcales bacterium]|nr:energy transducer TonB [Methylococcales bacterium]